jgi:transcriptional regulator with XRE-family HTH domain
MKITWKDIFDLILNMWDINQEKIAEYLTVHPSTISRLHSGKNPRFDKSINDIYNLIFDVNNEDSLAHQYDTDDIELLSRLKHVIKVLHLEDATADLAKNNYEELVMELLRLAKKNQPQKSSTKPNPTSSNENEITHKVPKKENIQPLPLSIEFKQCLEDYAVKNFIDADPISSPLSPACIEDSIRFIGVIKKILETKDSVVMTDDIDKNINSFVDMLLDYIKCLRNNSSNPNDPNFPYSYAPAQDHKNEMKEQIDEYRNHLASLLELISNEIDKEIDVEKKKRQLQNKLMWENIP